MTSNILKSPYLSANLISKYLIIAFSFAILYAFGIHGFMRTINSGSYFGFDFAVLHGAGQLLLGGGNPYLEYSHNVGAYAYPPQMGIFLLFYGMFSQSVALAIHTILNLISIGIFIWIANQWFLQINKLQNLQWSQALSVAVIIANPFMLHSVYQGQFSLLAFGFLLLAHHWRLNKRYLLSGIMLGLSTIKPQLCVLYIAWLCLERKFLILTIGGFVSVLIALPVLAILGPLESINNWKDSIEYYMSLRPNQLGYPHVIGFESFLHALGISNVSLKPILGVVFLGLFWWRKWLDDRFILIALTSLSLSFLYGHDSDYIALALLWSWLVYNAFQTRTWLLMVCVLMALYVFPQSFVRWIDMPGLAHWRVFLVPFATILLWHQLHIGAKGFGDNQLVQANRN